MKVSIALTQPKGAEDAKEIKTKEVIAVKVSGSVKWFNVKQGYGFINRNDTKEDVFVHQTAITNPNLKPKKAKNSLDDGEAVEFDVVIGKNGNTEASNVTGPRGTRVKGNYRVTDIAKWKLSKRMKTNMKTNLKAKRVKIKIHAFDIEKLRINCKTNLKSSKNETCVKDQPVVPKTQKNEKIRPIFSFTTPEEIVTVKEKHDQAHFTTAVPSNLFIDYLNRLTHEF